VISLTSFPVLKNELLCNEIVKIFIVKKTRLPNEKFWSSAMQHSAFSLLNLLSLDFFIAISEIISICKLLYIKVPISSEHITHTGCALFLLEIFPEQVYRHRLDREDVKFFLVRI
jgi:hypothetical protein